MQNLHTASPYRCANCQKVKPSTREYALFHCHLFHFSPVKVNENDLCVFFRLPDASKAFA